MQSSYFKRLDTLLQTVEETLLCVVHVRTVLSWTIPVYAEITKNQNKINVFAKFQCN